MRAKHVVTAILVGLMLGIGPATRANGAEESSDRDGSIRRPAPRLFSEAALERYGELERTDPAGDSIPCGQWTETDATAWVITIGVGTAIALALALHGPP